MVTSIILTFLIGKNRTTEDIERHCSEEVAKAKGLNRVSLSPDASKVARVSEKCTKLAFRLAKFT